MNQGLNREGLKKNTGILFRHWLPALGQAVFSTRKQAKK
jgi:hypothetical protein